MSNNIATAALDVPGFPIPTLSTMSLAGLGVLVAVAALMVLRRASV